jgi:hypothetical protein
VFLTTSEDCRGLKNQIDHRVGRVISFSPVGLPQPLTRRRVCNPPPPPFGSGGGAHSLAKEGVGESQFRRGDMHYSTLYIYVLCEIEPLLSYWMALSYLVGYLHVCWVVWRLQQLLQDDLQLVRCNTTNIEGL